MTDGQFANNIPDFMRESPVFGDGLKDQAAATGTEDFTGVVSSILDNLPGLHR